MDPFAGAPAQPTSATPVRSVPRPTMAQVMDALNSPVDQAHVQRRGDGQQFLNTRYVLRELFRIMLSPANVVCDKHQVGTNPTNGNTQVRVIVTMYCTDGILTCDGLGEGADITKAEAQAMKRALSVYEHLGDSLYPEFRTRGQQPQQQQPQQHNGYQQQQGGYQRGPRMASEGQKNFMRDLGISEQQIASATFEAASGMIDEAKKARYGKRNQGNDGFPLANGQQPT